MYSTAAASTPQIPLAGSQMTSPALGTVNSSMSLTWRGMLNAPLRLAPTIFPNMYSYRSPLASISPLGT